MLNTRNLIKKLSKKVIDEVKEEGEELVDMIKHKLLEESDEFIDLVIEKLIQKVLESLGLDDDDDSEGK
jgi:predicted Zn-dependent protease with MMP-like domain